ncbi:putative S-adenosylmethionine decarboxylase [Prunus yedoensis var. nudiflora]|uniref:Putative S-adenosylmethionine decarboxylase n=2 Tax=Prunus TaxID=3754 RepID=A0A314Y5M9_PRUYE|nr:putative S-adenosylmethionine decarboxylase [Prunus yedoensis var. nudiflora]
MHGPLFPVQQITMLGKKLNELMESKGGKKKSSSSKSLFYEAPLGYSIEDVRPHGGIKKFRSAAYSNCVRKPS